MKKISAWYDYRIDEIIFNADIAYGHAYAMSKFIFLGYL